MGWSFDLALLNFTDSKYHAFRQLFIREFNSRALDAYQDAIMVLSFVPRSD